jgi:micrococcal nuclease
MTMAPPPRLWAIALLALASPAPVFAQATELRDPCGPFGGAIVENWARPATPTEQARVETLRQDCRRTQPAPAPPCDAADPTLRTVTRVIDGDTIVLDQGERVRLIGIDTPELHHPTKPVQYFAREAAAFTTHRFEGKTVQLAYDWQRQDRFGRTLAYVCLPDGELVNETIVRDGFGFAYLKYPFRADLMTRFRAAEREARDARRGLWAPPSSVPAPSTGPH